MAVLRGKLSEGFDFEGDLARMVIVVGIPYPLYTDPRVILKRDYLDRKIKYTSQVTSKMLSGWDWY